LANKKNCASSLRRRLEDVEHKICSKKCDDFNTRAFYNNEELIIIYDDF
jgi:hypothetical protein